MAAMVATVVMVLTVSTYAITARTVNPVVGLSFQGTTAVCHAKCFAGSDNDNIQATLLPGYEQPALVMKIDVGQIVLDFFHRFFVTNFPCVLMLLEKLLHLAERNAILPFSDYRLDSYFFLFC